MPWFIQKSGSKAVVIAAVNAIAGSANGNANNQLARAKSSMITEINACAGPLVSLVGGGDFTSNYSESNFTVQTIPGVVGSEIASTPP